MAESPTQSKKATRRRGGSRRSSTSRNGGSRSPADQADRPSTYAREAVEQWGEALRYGVAAISPMATNAGAGMKDALERRKEGRSERRSLLERVNPATTEKGGRIGDVADKVLSKMGTPGKLGSAFSLGSRAVQRMRDGGGDETSDEPGGRRGGFGDRRLGVPIQEAIEVAVPPEVAYGLCTKFEDYPEFVDRIKSVEELDDGHLKFEVKLRGLPHTIEVEIFDERPNERLDWRGVAGIEHSGVISFHELAPRLTHLELSVELDAKGLMDRIRRSTHLTERAIRADLRRFKAYAELWEEDEAPEAREPEDEEAAPQDEAGVEEPDQPADEEDLTDDEELEDEEELYDEDEPEDEELDEDEELGDTEELEEEPLSASGSR